jgi:hypothetical protein
MPAPATTGQLRTNISDMEIGDYISCSVARGSTIALTTIYNLGKGHPSGEIPLTGLGTTAGIGGMFYFVKVDKGLLIADRVVINTVSWDQLNSSKWVEGVNFESIGKIRSLSGGVSYADGNGNRSNTELGFGGWPTTNEWDSYVINFPSSKISTGKAKDDVFHINGISTLCKETPIISLNVASNRIQRRGDQYFFWSNPSSYSHALIGFRPVFEYREV